MLTPSVGEALTRREAEVLALVAQGLTHRGIAARLGNNPKTVRNHMTAIYAKLGIHSQAAAALAAVRLGLVTVP